MICASVKRLFRMRVLLQKVGQILDDNEGNFGGQVRSGPKRPNEPVIINLFGASGMGRTRMYGLEANDWDGNMSGRSRGAS